MINEKKIFLTVSWLSGLLSAEIFISTGEWGGPDATPNLWKQLFSAVRASGGYPGNDVTVMTYPRWMAQRNTVTYLVRQQYGQTTVFR